MDILDAPLFPEFVVDDMFKDSFLPMFSISKSFQITNAFSYYPLKQFLMLVQSVQPNPSNEFYYLQVALKDLSSMSFGLE